MLPNKIFLDRIQGHQLDFLAAFDRGEARFSCLEWHRRAYKTTTAINLLIRECAEHPRHKYVYVAPTQVMAREIVWDDPNMLPDALPPKEELFWRRNEQKMTITFANGSVLKIAGADNPDSLRGIDIDGGASDEDAQHKPTVWTEIIRPIISGKPKKGDKLRFWVFLYTPKGPNHATMRFNINACIEDEGELPTKGRSKKNRPGWYCSRLIADESKIIPQEELDTILEEVKLGLIPLSFYEQEYQCRRVTEEERTLITSAMMERLKTRKWEFIKPTEIRRIVAIDPAFGGDLCCLKGFENGKVIAENSMHFGGVKALTHEVVFEAKKMASEINTKNFIVDCIGNGKGVADDLAIDEADYHVQYFESAGKVENSVLYANRKAEAVNYVAGEIIRCEVEPIKNPETRRQLTYLSRYKVNNRGRMLMMANDDVKTEIGCSPDQGLCYVYGRWGLKNVVPEIISERKTWREREHRKSPMQF